jgi:hypothetical protein
LFINAHINFLFLQQEFERVWEPLMNDWGVGTRALRVMNEVRLFGSDSHFVRLLPPEEEDAIVADSNEVDAAHHWVRKSNFFGTHFLFVDHLYL